MKHLKEDNEWFEISKDIISDSQKPTRKPKFLADASIPQEFVNEVKSAGISIVSAYEIGIANLDDEGILQKAKSMKRILITVDEDFWNERKFPLHIHGGIIYIATGPSSVRKVLHSFGCIWSWFARYFPAQGWESMKAKATENIFMIKMHNFEGKNIGYEIKGG